MSKSIQELEDEVRVRKMQEHKQKYQAQIKKEEDFRKETGVDVFTSDDYCGMVGGKYSFYFGYEETVCPKHKTNTERCDDLDCELSEWAFTATVDGKEVMRLPQSRLHPKQGEEPFFHLLTGIALYLKRSN